MNVHETATRSMIRHRAGDAPESARDVTAADVMSAPVVTVPESGTIFDAWTVMVTCHVRHTVVLRDDHPIGVIEDRNLVDAWQEGPGALRATPCKQLVRDPTPCVLPDTPLQRVAAVMNQAHVDAMPVVAADGKLLGLITAGDVVHAVSRHGIHAERDRREVSAP